MLLQHKDFDESSLIPNNFSYGIDCNINYFRGSSYFELGNYKMALEDFKECSDCNRADFIDDKKICRKELGITYVKLLEFDKAIDIFNDLLELCNSSCEDNFLRDIYYNLGTTYFVLFNFSKASFYLGWAKLYGKTDVSDIIKVIFDNNDKNSDSKTYIEAGLEKEKSGYFRQAIEDYDNAIIKNPLDLDAYYYRGKCYFKIKDYSNSLIDLLYYSLMTDKSGNVDAMILESAFYTKNTIIAVKFLDYFLDYYKNSSGVVFDYTYKRADFNYQLGNYSNAIKDYKKLLALSDSDEGKGKWNYLIGNCNLKLNKKDKACNYFRKAKKYKISNDFKNKLNQLIKKNCN